MEQEAKSLLSLKREALGDLLSQQEPRLQGFFREPQDGPLHAAMQIHHRRQLVRLLTEPTLALPSMPRPSSPGLLAQSLGRLPLPMYGETTSIRTQMLQEILLRNEVNRYLEDRMARAQQLELLKSQIPASASAASFEPLGRSVPAVSPLAASPVPNHLGSEAEDERPAAKRPKADRNAKPSSAVASDAAAAAAAAAAKRPPPSSSSPPKKNKDLKWLASLDKLKRYRNQVGDCIVPRGYAQDPQLASWVAEQRKQYKLLQDGKQSSITPERVAMLQELGFSWNAQESAWSRHLEDLKEFRAEHGHCHVPLAHPQYPKLGLWTKEQRRHYTLLKQGKQSHMTLERVRELDKVGFCWDTHEATWLERYRELVAFKERNGHCLVPTNYTQNVKLGTWIHHQRRQYKKHKEGKPCHITEDRIRALDTLGFVWSTRAGKSDGSGSLCSDTEMEHDEELNAVVTHAHASLKRKRASSPSA